MSTNELFNTLLRPAVLHILRAQGFHAAKPTVIDTLTDITARYMMLLAQKTATFAFATHNSTEPNLTDVRMAMQECGILYPTLTASEETWKELLRKPLEEFPERNGLRAKERMRRDAEDTQDVRDFIDWVKGDQNKEIKRIAGLQQQHITETTELDTIEMEDYLVTLMKKHSKTGVEARFQGTVLGQPADPKPIKIEGGPETLEEWCRKTRENNIKAAAEALLHTPPANKDSPPVKASAEANDLPDVALEDASGPKVDEVVDKVVDEDVTMET